MNCQSSIPGRNPESTIAGRFASSTIAPRIPEKWVAPAVMPAPSCEIGMSGVSVPGRLVVVEGHRGRAGRDRGLEGDRHGARERRAAVLDPVERGHWAHETAHVGGADRGGRDREGRVGGERVLRDLDPETRGLDRPAAPPDRRRREHRRRAGREPPGHRRRPLVRRHAALPGIREWGSLWDGRAVAGDVSALDEATAAGTRARSAGAWHARTGIAGTRARSAGARGAATCRRPKRQDEREQDDPQAAGEAGSRRRHAVLSSRSRPEIGDRRTNRAFTGRREGLGGRTTSARRAASVVPSGGTPLPAHYAPPELRPAI